MPARVKKFFCIFYSLFSFFRHTTPLTPKSGLIFSVKSLLRRPRLVRNLSVVFQSDPNISSIRTSTKITNSDSLRREWDAQSSGRLSTAHYVRYRAVPRTNRTLTTVNTHNHSATSSTSELPASAPSLPWQCSCADASPGAGTDVASPAGYALLLGRPPPTRSATRNCLAC